MITNFKLFESIEELKIEKFSYWIIYGSRCDCIEILKKLRYQLYDDEHNLYTIIEKMDISIRNNTNIDSTVTILCFQNDTFLLFF